MFRITASIVVLSFTLGLHPVSAGESGDEVREALQALQDYIGSWKGNGALESDRTLWKESTNWGWRFKGKDAWLTLEFPDSKHFKKGEMRFLPDKEIYQLTLVDVNKKKQIFEGKLKKGVLTLERKDAESKETQQLKMNMAGGGIRSIYTYSVKPENRTLYTKRWQVSFTKEGESFGTAQKRVECIVTGGLGTMAVSFNGATYYVCCSGCRDAFNENPEKFVKLFLNKKKGK
jgi:hypothetical protein